MDGLADFPSVGSESASVLSLRCWSLWRWKHTKAQNSVSSSSRVGVWHWHPRVTSVGMRSTFECLDATRASPRQHRNVWIPSDWKITCPKFQVDCRYYFLWGKSFVKCSVSKDEENNYRTTGFHCFPVASETGFKQGKRNTNRFCGIWMPSEKSCGEIGYLGTRTKIICL